MQLGFLAGAIGLILRDSFIIYTIENWKIIVLSELAFGVVVGIGFSYTPWAELRLEIGSGIFNAKWLFPPFWYLNHTFDSSTDQYLD